MLRVTRVIVVLAALLLIPATAAAKTNLKTGGAKDMRATIKYTRYGVPHITAPNVRSLAFGWGYAFAKDNICEIAETYVTVNGDRSRWFGPDGKWTFSGNSAVYNNLESDFFYQQINDSGLIEDLLTRKPPEGPKREVKQGVRGYVAGYNHYLGQVGRKGISDPACRGERWVRPIKAIDSYRRFFQLASLASQGVAIGSIASAAPVAGAEAAAKQQAFERWTSDPDSAQGLMKIQPQIGSNAYGIGADASSNGKGLLYGNPHFPWDGSERLYQSHLRVPGKIDVQGASLMGVPLINIGWTKGLAWSHTVATAWRFIPYQLTLAPGDPYSYVIDGQTRPMERRVVTVKVRTPEGLEERTNTIYYTEFGPVFDSLQGIPLPWLPTTAFAMHDVNESNFRYLNHFFANNKAQSVAEYDRIQAKYQGIPWVNSIAADRKGNAYYSMGGAIPYVTDEKAAACATAAGQATFAVLGLPLMDGSRSDCLPDSSPEAAAPGIFPHSEIPTLIRSDYVENGNDSHWLTNPHEPLTGFDRVIGIEGAERTYRTRIGLIQAEERIAGTDGFSGKGFNLERLENVSFGNRNYLGELWRDDLVGLCRLVPVMAGRTGAVVDVGDACDALAAWDLRDNLDSRGSILFRRFATRLLGNFRSLPTGTQGFTRPGDQTLYTRQYSSADPLNTPSGLNVLNPLVQAALADAVADLEGIGAAPDDPLGIWQYDVRGDQRIPIHGGPGGHGVFNVISARWNPREGYSDVYHGSSFIAAVQFKGGKCPVKADTFVTYSQSQDPTSKHVNDFTKAYSKKRWSRAASCMSQVNRDPKLKVLKVRSGG